MTDDDASTEFERGKTGTRDELPTDSLDPSTVARTANVACSTCVRVVEHNAPSCAQCGADRPADGWTEVSSVGDAWIGRTIDQTYRVVGLLGQGGMGSVYEAESLSVSRSFALKIVDPDGRDQSRQVGESLRDRLHREIEAQSSLRNPHVVPLFDALLLPGDHVAMVMDFIDGVTLQELVNREGPLPVERACDIARQVANGLQEAHEAGMIHRDLKPENIMIEILPAGGDFVRVFDFGVVSFSGDASQTRGFVGTPLYASPEQACGEDVDPGADIYSLGAVLFAMLTGRPPFVVDELYDALHSHVHESPPTLGQVLPERLFPEKLEDLVSRMLAKQRSGRPASMAQLISELDALREGLASHSSVPSSSVTSLEERSNAQTIVPEDGESSQAKVIDRPAERTQDSSLDAAAPEAQIISSPNATDAGTTDVRRSVALSQVQVDEFPGTLPVPVRDMETPHVLGDECWAISATGRLVYVDREGCLHLVDSELGSGWTIDLELEGRPGALALAGEMAFVGVFDGRLVRWELDGGHSETIYERPTGAALNAVAVDHTGDFVVLATFEGEVRCAKLDVPENPVWRRVGEGGHEATVDVAGDASAFATLVGGDDVSIYTATWPHDRIAHIKLPAPARLVRLSQDGSMMACLTDDDELGTWRLPDGQPVGPLRPLRDVVALEFNADDELVLLRRAADVSAES